MGIWDVRPSDELCPGVRVFLEPDYWPLQAGTSGADDKQLWELWKSTAGQLLARLKGELPSPVFEDLERLVQDRNWLAHEFFRTYSVQRLSDERKAQEAVHRLDRLAQDFKDASTGLLALRTRVTPRLDSEDKIRALWANHGPTLSSELGG